MKKLLVILTILLALAISVNPQLDSEANDSEIIPILENIDPIVQTGEVTQEPSIISQFIQTLKSNSRKIWAGLVALVLLIIIVKIVKRKPSPEKLYRKAEALHKEAKEFHDDGDSETAQELYQKAEELRDKARESESSGV